MREVNFSIPSANKASVGITTALYDRRALDCTSTLPLINSLNHLAYLTTSSARIREILTIDGGVERLVCILKNGRTKDMMDTWKWNLAFQCVFNIGVRGSDSRGSDSRGSENIRTRVVEADIVPVIATILDNYMSVVERQRARQEDENVKRSRSKACRKRNPVDVRVAGEMRMDRRREPPPPIQVPPTPTVASAAQQSESRRHHHHGHRRHMSLPGQMQAVDEVRPPPNSRTISHATHLHAPEAFGPPPMTSTSQPDSPVTPAPPLQALGTPRQSSPSPGRLTRRPSIRHQHSTSGDSEDDARPDVSRNEPMLDFEGQVNVSEMADASVLEHVDGQETIAGPNVTGNVDAETFSITHRSADGSIIDSNATPQPDVRFSPAQPPFVANPPAPEPPQPLPMNRFMQDTTGPSDPVDILASVPRDEDVVMSLQLLAYVSKYCDLRSYFQQSHLVPRLKISRELARLDGDEQSTLAEEDIDNDAEYTLPNDYNIFPLVEKFTVKHHSNDMKYWAGVVMRNLCRKDKSRGDIRQCAYYKCGRWEDYARQFAKCRRCRQTKYCSKECQKSAWTLHRWWCTVANDR